MTLTVSPKTLSAELKPICAAIRKQTNPNKRYQMPLMGAVRIQKASDRLTAAYLWDEDQCVKRLGPFPNPDASLDVLLDLDNAYALATILDPKKPATLTVEEWNGTYQVNQHGFPNTIKYSGRTLVVTQPSACPGRTDVMRFKVIEP